VETALEGYSGTVLCYG
jgi:kinesin family protein 6/9